jgi:hypothetical protein
MYTEFWWGKLKKRNQLENPGVEGRKILKWVLQEIDRKGADWIHLAQDRDKWRAPVNKVRKLPVPQNVANFTSFSRILLSRDLYRTVQDKCPALDAAVNV